MKFVTQAVKDLKLPWRPRWTSGSPAAVEGFGRLASARAGLPRRSPRRCRW